MARVVAFGELLLRLKAPGAERLLQTPVLEATFGGAEFNVLASLARFGVETAYVSVLPDSMIGEAAYAEIRRFGVGTSGIARVSGRLGVYFLEAGAQARPTAVIYDRAASAFCQLDPAGFDWPAILAGADLLHLTGIPAALGDRSLAALVGAARTARAGGSRVSLDVNIRPALWASRERTPFECLEPVIAEATVVFAGPDDWTACLGTQPLTGSEAPFERFQVFAAALLTHYPRLSAVISTLRSARSADEQALSAACVARDGTVASAGPRAITHVVDRIGSGDAFVAGFLYGKLERWAWQPALDFGLAAAVLKHTIPGDINRIGVAEVRALLAGEDGARVRR
jgi:2-dehydro-3-deoxygluconokinase